MALPAAEVAMEWLQEHLCNRLPLPVFSSTPLLLLVLALPHLLYALVWVRPTIWLRTFGRRSLPIFASFGAAGKVLQFSFSFLWVWSSMSSGLCPRLTIAPWQLVAAAALIGYGQALNFGTYRALGVAGVYYGCRLGVKVPWVEGWPFTAIRHPQYVGSALTVWGVLAVLYSGMPMPLSLWIAIYWTGLYVFSGLLEDYHTSPK